MLPAGKINGLLISQQIEPLAAEMPENHVAGMQDDDDLPPAGVAFLTFRKEGSASLRFTFDRFSFDGTPNS